MADAPILVKWLLTLPLWHVDAVEGGGVHPIAFGGSTQGGRATTDGQSVEKLLSRVEAIFKMN
jgi:hypothetical protein